MNMSLLLLKRLSPLGRCCRTKQLVGCASYCERQQLAQPVITVTAVGPCEHVGEKEARAIIRVTLHTQLRRVVFLPGANYGGPVHPSDRNCRRDLHNISF